MLNMIRLLLIFVLFTMPAVIVATETPPLKPTEKAVQTDSGLNTEILQTSESDAQPQPTDMVTVHYTGWLNSGAVFDSSVKRGQPVTFQLDKVMTGWAEGVQLMKVGEKRRMWIPAELAYGNSPKPGAPKGDLIFEVELLAIKKPQPAPATPVHLKAPPANATKTASGLATLVLNPGTGQVSPRNKSIVKVHYTGWTGDGNIFDSSVIRDEPLIFPVDRVIPGWTETLKLMTVEEKRRIWVPAQLAYGENPPNGAPRGMLVFEIELLEIKNL